MRLPESGEDEPEAMRHGEARGEVHWTPRDAVSVLDTVVWPVVGRRHVGDELGGGACGEAPWGRCGWAGLARLGLGPVGRGFFLNIFAESKKSQENK